MWLYLALGVVVLVAILLIVIATRPAAFSITRIATFSAPPAVVFPQVNDFRNWEAWSPWAKLDPQVKNTFDGPPAGEGAGYAWSGNSKVGEGRMRILESHANEQVKILLEFIRPFKATNTTVFTFKPVGSQTEVNWTMYGRNNFMSKAFGLFCDIDKMVGKDFEKGLAQMKSIVERSPQ